MFVSERPASFREVSTPIKMTRWVGTCQDVRNREGFGKVTVDGRSGARLASAKNSNTDPQISRLHEAAHRHCRAYAAQRPVKVRVVSGWGC